MSMSDNKGFSESMMVPPYTRTLHSHCKQGCPIVFNGIKTNMLKTGFCTSPFFQTIYAWKKLEMSAQKCHP